MKHDPAYFPELLETCRWQMENGITETTTHTDPKYPFWRITDTRPVAWLELDLETKVQFREWIDANTKDIRKA